eukprot:237259-Chlamydomonas_euryale.AAC.6
MQQASKAPRVTCCQRLQLAQKLRRPARGWKTGSKHPFAQGGCLPSAAASMGAREGSVNVNGRATISRCKGEAPRRRDMEGGA